MINKRRVIDLAERVIMTFVGAFIAVYLVAFAAGESDIAFLKDPGLFDKAKTAGIAAVVPLVAGLIGFRVGDKNSGSVVSANKPEEVAPVFQYQYIDNPEGETHGES